MFQSFAFAWPNAIKSLLVASTMSTFAVELVAPECSIRFTFTQKWAAMQLFPPIMAALLSLGVVLVNVLPYYYTRRRRARAAHAPDRLALVRMVESTSDAIVGGLFTLLYYTCVVAANQLKSMHFLAARARLGPHFL